MIWENSKTLHVYQAPKKSLDVLEGGVWEQNYESQETKCSKFTDLKNEQTINNHYLPPTPPLQDCTWRGADLRLQVSSGGRQDPMQLWVKEMQEDDELIN